MVAAMARHLRAQGLEPRRKIQRLEHALHNVMTASGRDIGLVNARDNVVWVLQARCAANTCAYNTNPMVLPVVRVANSELRVLA